MKLYINYRMIFDYSLSSLFCIIFLENVDIKDLGFRWLDDQNRVAFASGLMGVAASLLGLVLAASSFLVTHVQGDRFKPIRREGSWSEFASLTRSCLWRLLFLTIFSGISILSTDDNFKYIAVLLIFLIVLVLLALSTLIWVTTAIISIPH